MLTLEHQYDRTIKPEDLAALLGVAPDILMENASLSFAVEIVLNGIRSLNEKVIEVVGSNQDIEKKRSNGKKRTVILRKSVDDTSVPVICFYEDDKFWMIGEMGKIQKFKKVNGFKFIHFQLCHPNKRFRSEEVYNCGSIAVDLDNGGNGNSTKFGDEGFQLMGEDYEPEIDDKASQNYKNQIMELQTQLTKPNELTSEKKRKIKKEIEVLVTTLSNKNRGIQTGNAENARTNVSKRMKEALQKIYANERVGYLERYLNKATLERRGKRNFYQPDPNDKPRWILHKNELPS